MFKVSTEKEVDKNGKDEKTKWFFEVPDSLIKRYFIAITRLAETPTSFAYSPHQEIAEGMYSFHVTPDKKFLHLKEYLATAFCDTLNLISKAVDLSNTDPVVGTFKIISHEKGVYKIDVTSFLLADKIMSLHPSIRQNYHVSYMDNNRSDIVSVHSYPGNVEIHTNRTYITSKPTYSSRDGFMTVGINTSLVLLPKQPMQMRLADPRVGFRSLSTLNSSLCWSLCFSFLSFSFFSFCLLSSCLRSCLLSCCFRSSLLSSSRLLKYYRIKSCNYCYC